MKKKFLSVLPLLLLLIGISGVSFAQPTHIKIKAMAGIGYSVNWVKVWYVDAQGEKQSIMRQKNIDVGEEMNITVPDGSTKIRLEAKPAAAKDKTRIFNQLELSPGEYHCFELRGKVNSPRYKAIKCHWTPGGRITVFDSKDNKPVGLRNVKVEVKNPAGTYTYGSTYTDQNGDFRLNRTVDGKVRYKVIFKDAEGLKVKYGANSHAEWVSFEAMNTNLNYQFKRSDSKNWYWASIFNATQYYKEYAEADGIPFKKDAQITGLYEDGISRAMATGIQDVTIRKYKKPSHKIFENVMHELAHVSHAKIDRDGYANFVANWGLVNGWRAAYGEAWAAGISGIYTERRYYTANYELNIYQRMELADYTYQHWKIKGDHLYIYPIVIDLIDTVNQRNNTDGELFPIDRVSGYTFEQIAKSLKGARSLDGWKTNLKKYENPTKDYLNEYFNQYFEDRARDTSANTIIKLKPMGGVGYTVDWVVVAYDDKRGNRRKIQRKRDINLGQKATITVPEGATNIELTAKPRGSGKKVRIFDRLSLTPGTTHCFHLKGAVNSPRYIRKDCNEY